MIEAAIDIHIDSMDGEEENVLGMAEISRSVLEQRRGQETLEKRLDAEADARSNMQTQLKTIWMH